MPHYIEGQTDVAALDIAFNIFLEAWLIVFPGDKFSYFIDTKMVSQ